MRGNGGKWGKLGGNGESRGKCRELVEEDGKKSTKVAKILQTRAPILFLGSVLLGILDDLDGHTTHTLKGVHLVGHTKNKGKRAQGHWKEVKL